MNAMDATPTELAGQPALFSRRLLRLLRNENIYCGVGVDYKATPSLRFRHQSIGLQIFY